MNNLPVDQISTVAFAINGQRAANNEFLLDGAPNSAPAQNQPVINATPDLVLEFKVETNNFSAEYGRAAGGVFNVIKRAPFKYNQFGGTIGRNKALCRAPIFSTAISQTIAMPRDS